MKRYTIFSIDLNKVIGYKWFYHKPKPNDFFICRFDHPYYINNNKIKAEKKLHRIVSLWDNIIYVRETSYQTLIVAKKGDING